MPELIAHSLDDYFAPALRLAGNENELAALKAKLARNRQSAPLFDTMRFTRDFEAALTHMHERFKSGLPSAHFAVP